MTPHQPARGRPEEAARDASNPQQTATARSKPPRRLALSLLIALGLLSAAGATDSATTASEHSASTTTSTAPDSRDRPAHRIPNIGQAAEWYFGPDGKTLIGNAKREGDKEFHVYTVNIDGSNVTKLNDKGSDACSFLSRDGKRAVWTSTRDHPELPPGDWSNGPEYPLGAELYSSKLDGSDVVRITSNTVYDAEVTYSPGDKYYLFGRQTNRKMDLWRVPVAGGEEFQITHMDGWEPGGAQYLADGKTILFRAWKSTDQGKKRSGLPMEIFTIKDDGTDLRQITNDGGTNWAPFPAPDGRHYVFVKVLPPRNYELFLGDLETSDQVRLTYNDAFDGFPSISPDGRLLQFTSSRASSPKERLLTLFLMDISDLNVGPKSAKNEAAVSGQ